MGHPLHCVGQVASAGHAFKNTLEYFHMAQHLIQLGAVVNVAVTSGANAVDFLLCNGGIVTPRVDQRMMNRKFLRLLIRENALQWLGEEHAQIHMCCDSRRSSSDPTLLEYSNVDMCAYLYELGFNLKAIEELSLGDNANSERLPTKIKTLLKEVEDTKLLSLQRSCRRCIRRTMGSSLSTKASNLGLPPVLQDFLYITEI